MIYSVSWCVSADDTGCCCSYRSREERDRCAAKLRADGVWHVRCWEC